MKNVNETNARRNAGLVILFVIAALIVLLVLLFSTKGPAMKYELTIQALGEGSMTAISNYEDLGAGEIILVYSEDMRVQDVNGQEIDLAELSAENRIRVELAPREKVPGSEGYLDPVIETITLLPEGSDRYI